ncbi:MAG: ABC transporter ATP-binding protein [Firmicutes bacterium]|nr:ABC transporter ATP-binding protein [Bacillota bacterium]
MADGLVKVYNGVRALDGVSFRVEAGELFGLLGRNGAGKTTAIEILCGLRKPDVGTARVGGLDVVRDPRAVRAICGVVHQVPSLDRWLTVYENLDFYCRIYGIPRSERQVRIREALALADLTGAAGRMVTALSGGMRRRLEIARALLHRPRVLFLDEPTIGLDPAARREIWAFIADLRRREGVTVLFSTHYLGEAEFCDRVLILERGRVLASGSPAELKAAAGVRTQVPPAPVTLEEAYLHLTQRAVH